MSDFTDERESGEGSTVTVSDLFYALPVRKKAIESHRIQQTNDILRFLQRLCLFHPTVSFVLNDMSSMKTSFRTPLSSEPETTLSRFKFLYGSEKADALRPLKHEYQAFCLSGWLSPPSSTVLHHTKELQFVSVNGRWIEHFTALTQLINALFTRCSKLIGGNGQNNDQKRVRRTHTKILPEYWNGNTDACI
jgi:DNA mismatch repair ATPase MutL